MGHAHGAHLALSGELDVASGAILLSAAGRLWPQLAAPDDHWRQEAAERSSLHRADGPQNSHSAGQGDRPVSISPAVPPVPPVVSHLRVQVDAGGVTFVDLCGLAALEELARRAAAAGTPLHLSGLDTATARVLRRCVVSSLWAPR
ncbi:STAS domain-containing protein [Quadrisphaera sp. INWT6]|uniref:STAS domain-containing protein n=1 Tax=Quadrisphaera sp. INWT6 TaxID=2596917 RepID=UPI0018926244|nr:STAS domain-containing protein [Quadrisphaera sp. INWT6]